MRLHTTRPGGTTPPISYVAPQGACAGGRVNGWHRISHSIPYIQWPPEYAGPGAMSGRDSQHDGHPQHFPRRPFARDRSPAAPDWPNSGMPKCDWHKSNWNRGGDAASTRGLHLRKPRFPWRTVTPPTCRRGTPRTCSGTYDGRTIEARNRHADAPRAWGGSRDAN